MPAMFGKTLGLAALVATATAATNATTLADVCTNAFAKAAVPAPGFFQGITVDSSSAVATAVYNASVSGNIMYPDATFDYCNITFSYSHNGRKDDKVTLTYWLPAPDEFQDRFLSTGGGGYLISSGSGSLPGGIMYGAVAGTTDGGFGSLTTQYDEIALLANGTLNYENLEMFGYHAIHEMSVLGKEFTKRFYNMGQKKLYSYYQGCSEGGRDGWSQIQRFADQWDGAVVGAPAFRFAFQQVQHAYSDVVQQTLNYYPPPCALEKILNETIKTCDAYDGKVDGVVARTDLCKLRFDINHLIGTHYSCAASPVDNGFPPHPAYPAVNGTINAKDVNVAKTIIDGLHDSEGRQVYLSYQPGAEFADAYNAYNETTGKYESWPSDFAAAFVGPFIKKINQTTWSTNATALAGVTYDTLKDWIYQGWMEYEDTLHTTWPDLTPFHKAGGKILHYHGESDFSIPTESSVHYRESVRKIMYPHLSYNASNEALNDWYRFYLVPGAGHCNTNLYQPNGPFPQTNLAVLIDWVEKEQKPDTLNATILQGEHLGENAQICAWPLRPLYAKNGSLECVYDQRSIDTWHHEFDAFKMPVY